MSSSENKSVIVLSSIAKRHASVRGLSSILIRHVDDMQAESATPPANVACHVKMHMSTTSAMMSSLQELFQKSRLEFVPGPVLAGPSMWANNPFAHV
ncbi:hypothetical protein LIER_19226 [Lithospermum erythrorhizon]|uniref:Uncharacterized protein n=1 Tax=Lithospermum erythrorhizon TaxID=34254 RepID=A0AAV3QGX2_LITER